MLFVWVLLGLGALPQWEGKVATPCESSRKFGRDRAGLRTPPGTDVMSFQWLSQRRGSTSLSTARGAPQPCRALDSECRGCGHPPVPMLPALRTPRRAPGVERRVPCPCKTPGKDPAGRGGQLRQPREPQCLWSAVASPSPPQQARRERQHPYSQARCVSAAPGEGSSPVSQTRRAGQKGLNTKLRALGFGPLAAGSRGRFLSKRVTGHKRPRLENQEGRVGWKGKTAGRKPGRDSEVSGSAPE